MAFLIYGGSLWRKTKSKKTQEQKGKLPDTGFSGDKTMRSFEQPERQTCEHFEEWLERKAS
jgi:hypothetical protein